MAHAHLYSDFILISDGIDSINFAQIFKKMFPDMYAGFRNFPSLTRISDDVVHLVVFN